MEMNVLVLKTNITSQNQVRKIQAIFSKHSAIKRWTVDTEDVDKVLRIEALPNLNEPEVLALVRGQGFKCEELEG